MAATAEVKYCKYCWRPASIAGHNDGCPIGFVNSLVPVYRERVAKERMAEWKRGHNHGFNVGLDGYDEIEPWQYCRYSKAYLFGYRAGITDLERAIDTATENRW